MSTMPSSSSGAKPKKPTQEELDEERLREIEAKVKELLQLISEGHDREKADAALGEARAKRDEQAGNRKERVYHRERVGKSIPMTQHTSAHLKLASALKLRIQLGEYAQELEDSLSRLAEEQVEVLERKLKRARY